MLAEFFRKSGWEVFADPALSEQDVFNTIGEKGFHIIGISIGSYDQKKSTKKLISEIKNVDSLKAVRVAMELNELQDKTTGQLIDVVKQMDANMKLLAVKVLELEKKNESSSN